MEGFDYAGTAKKLTDMEFSQEDVIRASESITFGEQGGKPLTVPEEGLQRLVDEMGKLQGKDSTTRVVVDGDDGDDFYKNNPQENLSEATMDTSDGLLNTVASTETVVDKSPLMESTNLEGIAQIATGGDVPVSPYGEDIYKSLVDLQDRNEEIYKIVTSDKPVAQREEDLRKYLESEEVPPSVLEIAVNTLNKTVGWNATDFNEAKVVASAIRGESARIVVTSSLNNDTVNVTKNVVKTLLPFTNQMYFKSLLTSISEEEDLPHVVPEFFMWIGNNKEQFKDIVAQIPLDERKRFFDNLSELLVSNSKIVPFEDPNQAVVLESLDLLINNEMHLPSWGENIISWLDMLVFTRPVAKALTPAKKAKLLKKAIGERAAIFDTAAKADGGFGDIVLQENNYNLTVADLTRARSDNILSKSHPNTSVEVANKSGASVATTVETVKEVVSDTQDLGRTLEMPKILPAKRFTFTNLEEKIDSIINDAVADLLGTAGNKLSLGERKALEKEIRALQHELDYQSKSGPAAGKTKALKRETQETRARLVRAQNLIRLDDEAKVAEKKLLDIEEGRYPEEILKQIDDAVNQALAHASDPTVKISKVAEAVSDAINEQPIKGVKNTAKADESVVLVKEPVKVDASDVLEAPVNSSVLEELRDLATHGNIQLSTKELSNAAMAMLEKAKSKHATLDVKNSTIYNIESGRPSVKGVYIKSELEHWDNIEDAEEAIKYIESKEGTLYGKGSVQYLEGNVWRDVGDSSIATGKFRVVFNTEYEPLTHHLKDLDNIETDLKLFGIRPLSFLENFFNKSFTRYYKNPESIWGDSRMFSAAASSEYRSNQINKQLSKLAKSVRDGVNKLPKEQQKAWANYIDKLRREKLQHDYSLARLEGLSLEATKLADDHYRLMDVMWELNNDYLVKSLMDRGTNILFTNNGTRLLGYKVPKSELKQTVGKGLQYYDLESESVKVLNNIDELGGNTLFKTNGSVTLDNVAVDFVVGGVENYRAVHKGDKILDYRQGYTPTNYTHPYFVYQNITKDGKTYQQAVASAPSASEAKAIKERKQAEFNSANSDAKGDEFDYRSDIKDVNDIRHINEMIDNHIKVAGFQKHKGTQLESAIEEAGVASDNVLDVFTATEKALSSTSRRIGMSDWLNTAKERFVQQYGHVINTKGGKFFPHKLEEIATNKPQHRLDVAEAREMYDYIMTMQNVRLNSADTIWKYGWKSLADTFGTRSSVLSSVAESASNKLAKAKPVLAAKRVGFELMIAFNPASQIVLGLFDHLVKLPLAYHKHYARGLADSFAITMYRFGKDSNNPALREAYFNAAKISGRSRKEIEELSDMFENSGLYSSIDKHAVTMSGIPSQLDTTERLINTEAGRGVANTASRAYHKVRDPFYNAGFKFNEKFTNSVVWNTVRNAEGSTNLTKREFDLITSKTSTLNYSQITAGELTFNQTALSVLMQFLSVPYKGFLMALPKKFGGNKLVSGWQKTAMITSTLALVGTPDRFLGVPLLDPLTSKIEDPVLRNTVRDGLGWYFFFKTMDASVDTAKLNPIDPQGYVEKLNALFTEGGAAYIDSPVSGGVVPKFAELGRGIAGIFGWGSPEFSSLEYAKKSLMDTANLFTGVSNLSKGLYAINTGKFLNKNFDEMMDGATWGDGVLKMFGFTSLPITEKYISGIDMRDKRDQISKDVKQLYENFKKDWFAMRDEDVDSLKYMTQTYANFWLTYKGTSEEQFALSEFNKQVRYDVESGDSKFAKTILNAVGIYSEEELISIINTSGEDEEVKRNMLEFITNIKEAANAIGKVEVD